jgi:hypothetical protein
MEIWGFKLEMERNLNYCSFEHYHIRLKKNYLKIIIIYLKKKKKK